MNGVGQVDYGFVVRQNIQGSLCADSLEFVWSGCGLSSLCLCFRINLGIMS